jgi:hypothetical protein
MEVLAITDLNLVRVALTPADTEHICCGLVLVDISSLYTPQDVIRTLLKFEQLQRDFKNFLQPLTATTQNMLSARERLD